MSDDHLPGRGDDGPFIRWWQLNAARSEDERKWQGAMREQAQRRDQQMKDMGDRIERNDKRIDDMERWRDRYLGPLIIALAGVNVVAILVGIFK